MVVAFPIVAPVVAPSEVGTVKRGKEFVAHGLVVVGSKPVELIVESNVPGIAKTTGDDFEAGAVVVAAENASGDAPVIARVLVVFFVGSCSEVFGFRFGCAFGNIDSPEFTEGRGGNAIGQDRESFGISFRHVESAIGSELESMKSVFEIAEVGIDANVFVSDVITVGIANPGQLGRVGNPEPVTFPGEPLDCVEARSEFFAGFGSAVLVFVCYDPYRVGWGVRLRSAVLRSHSDAESALGIKSDCARIADEGIARKKRNFEVVGNDREVFRHLRFGDLKQGHAHNWNQTSYDRWLGHVGRMIEERCGVFSKQVHLAGEILALIFSKQRMVLFRFEKRVFSVKINANHFPIHGVPKKKESGRWVYYRTNPGHSSTLRTLEKRDEV